jgi:hypothetical protein
MEFNYRINEKMYLEAFSLHFWTPRRKLAFGFFGVIALFEIIQLSIAIEEGNRAGQGFVQAIAGDRATFSLVVLASLVLVSGVALLLPRWRIVRIYKRNPARDGIASVSATLEQLEVKIEGTGSSCFKWSFYKYWMEGRNVIVLALHTGQYQLLPKAGLSDAQQSELRGILSAVLPKK